MTTHRRYGIQAESTIVPRFKVINPILIHWYHLDTGQGNSEEGDDIPWESRRVLRFDLVTRDPSRVITYNYPISGNFTLSNITIDLSKEEPDWKELDHRMVVVTGFNQHLAYIGLGMIASVQAHMPLKKVIVYNLGIHPKIVKSVSVNNFLQILFI